MVSEEKMAVNCSKGKVYFFDILKYTLKQCLISKHEDWKCLLIMC